MSAGALRGLWRASELLELALQAVVSCPKWVVETTLRTSARAVHALTCRAISPVPTSLYYKLHMRGHSATTINHIKGAMPLPHGNADYKIHIAL